MRVRIGDSGRVLQLSLPENLMDDRPILQADFTIEQCDVPVFEK